MSHRTLHATLTSYAYQILARAMKSPPEEQVTARADAGDLTVYVQVALSGSAESSARMPGSWLSSTEQLIWNALEHKPLIGKQIAAKLGWEYTTKLRCLLSNLEDRGVLLHDEVDGYSRAPLPPA